LQVSDSVSRHRLDSTLQQSVCGLSCAVSAAVMSLVAFAAWLQNLVPVYDAPGQVTSSTLPLIFACAGVTMGALVVVSIVSCGANNAGLMTVDSRQAVAAPASGTAALALSGTQASVRHIHRSPHLRQRIDGLRQAVPRTRHRPWASQGACARKCLFC
jgi:hypothetical protein